MVMNTFEINQIHITFYWVSEYKPRYDQYGIIVSYTYFALHLADDEVMPSQLITAIAYKHTACISFLRISVDIDFSFLSVWTMFLAFCDLECSCVCLETRTHIPVDYEQNMFFS